MEVKQIHLEVKDTGGYICSEKKLVILYPTDFAALPTLSVVGATAQEAHMVLWRMSAQ